MTTITTLDQIPTLPTAEMVALYNSLTGKEISKFSSREAGIKQTTKAFEAAQAAQDQTPAEEPKDQTPDEEPEDQTPANQPEGEGVKELEACPICGETHFSPAGEPGTWLGDFAVKCENGHVIDAITHEEITGDLPESVLRQATEDHPKRKGPLNPQRLIDAKAAALETVGALLTYDKHSRLWTVTSEDGAQVSITSKDFSTYDKVTILELVTSFSAPDEVEEGEEGGESSDQESPAEESQDPTVN